jgi:hypothetical protein
MQTYGYRRLTISRILAGTPTLVSVINVVIFGVLVVLVAQTLGVADAGATAIGVVGALVASASFGWLAYHTISAARRAHRPLFPR